MIKTLKEIIGYIIALFAICLVALICYGIGVVLNKDKESDYKPPVEVIDIDSILLSNNSIKIVVNNIDSVKNAEVVEVLALDNDSTIKLFYKLVKE